MRLAAQGSRLRNRRTTVKTLEKSEMTYCLVSFLVDGVSVLALAMLRDMLRSKSFSSRKMGGPSLAINQPRRMLQHPVAPCVDSLGSGSVLPSLPAWPLAELVLLIGPSRRTLAISRSFFRLCRLTLTT